jgi:hypothetical protein
MPRKSLADVAPRTIRIHIPTYNKILEFFSMSTSGIRGSDAIRQVLYQFGKYCAEQMEAGRVAGAKDLQEAEETVLKTFGRKG